MRTFVTHQFSLLMFCTNLTVNNGDGRCSLPFQWFHLSTILPILGFYLKMYQLYDFTLIFFYGSAWRFLSKSFNDSTILSILLTLWLHCKSSSLSSRQNMSFYSTCLKSRYFWISFKKSHPPYLILADLEQYVTMFLSFFNTEVLISLCVRTK